MRSLGSTLLVLTLLAGTAPLAAQRLPGPTLLLEVRGGGGLPQGGFAGRAEGIGAQPGYALHLGGSVEVGGRFGVYGGVQRARFGCGECEEISRLDDSALETGLEAGAQVVLPYGYRRIRPWLRGGVIRRTLEVGGAEGGMTSEPGVGYSVGGGVRVPVGGRLAVSPAVHYRSYEAEFRFAELPPRTMDVSHLTLDVGLALRF